ncbi:hypothetical protein [Paeniglutamicibacter cryotolerans]|uniref:Uncharacterized protein n=1 Tax=Paeniglutamicibacter cryotolerans TaxID=670079 RepID=A0A839QP76_9MICC|nr:hypothetical protein [Paeniglutamicibacter cryotolerans]MBB2997560.1 hypothetical protein [Paeniglutamicibacter cryotolerans]
MSKAYRYRYAFVIVIVISVVVITTVTSATVAIVVPAAVGIVVDSRKTRNRSQFRNSAHHPRRTNLAPPTRWVPVSGYMHALELKKSRSGAGMLLELSRA